MFGEWDIATRDEPVVVKTGPTPASATQGKTLDRARRVAAELRQVLRVTDPGRVHRRAVVVYDDIFTTGHTLNEVARVLVAAGAHSVSGVVLARQPWGP